MGTGRGVKGVPKLAHKKSRFGCIRCRKRRVKCDEVHPTCGGCKRHRVVCEYDNREPRPKTTDPKCASSPSNPTSGIESNGTTIDFDKVGDPPETRERRMLELKLLHYYITKTCVTSIQNTTTGSATEFWTKPLSRLGFKHDAVLYAIYAVAALQMAREDAADQEAINAHRTYLDMTLQAHKEQIAHLNQENADATCMTSSIIRICALAMLSERPIEPYLPPTQWLHMTKTAVQVFKASWEWIKNDKNSIAISLVNQPPVLSLFNEKLFLESNRRSLLPLLEHDCIADVDELWDSGVYDAYATTLSYIGGVIIAICEGQEPENTIGRRLIVFGIMIPERFVELVDEAQPRALVVLSIYFALLSRFQETWYIGAAGSREVRGIDTVLPTKWRRYMEWQLDIVENPNQPISEPCFPRI